MATDTGTENEARMQLLSIIKELNANSIYPTFNDLLAQCRFKSFLEFEIIELKNKGYAEEISIKDDAGDYYRAAYKITEKGQNALEGYTSQAQDFISRLTEIFANSDDDALYKTLEDNRDLLRFAYQKGLITKSQVEEMAKRLQVNTERIWWGDNQGSPNSDWGWFPIGP